MGIPNHFGPFRDFRAIFVRLLIDKLVISGLPSRYDRQRNTLNVIFSANGHIFGGFTPMESNLSNIRK
jgi:hypothetical protein